MISRERVNRAWWSLKNEGPIIFSKKLARFIPWAIGRTRVRYSAYLPKPLRVQATKYDSDFLYLTNPIFNITSEDLSLSKEVQKQSKPEEIKSATWFVPYFDHLSFGGIYTIFRFINHFAEKGVVNRIVIYDNPKVDGLAMKAEIEDAFPHLNNIELVIYNPLKDKIKDLPQTDIAICTFWVSAYFLLRFNQTKRKYYFIQDYEPLFYEAGSTYALAESTYRFGFNGIVNTPGLLRAINQRHGLKGISFIPAVDHQNYYPRKHNNNKQVRIFFYARPNNPRNAFYLGIMIIKILLKEYGDKVEIVTAGADWSEKKFDLGGKITNLGLLKSMREVGELYRSCDIGFVYMLSKHPSYQPFEFMSTGMVTVTNNNEDNLWFLKDGTNCLIAEPSPAAMAEKIGWLIEDDKLRKKIQQGGYETVSTDWKHQMLIIWNDLVNSKD